MPLSELGSRKIRVLVVDDSSFIRSMYVEMLQSDPQIEVVGQAENPLEAREKIKQLNPDVMTLDIEMPKMDGLSFLEKVMSLRPMPVVMSSSLTQKGTAETIRALELGAVEVIGKPVEGERAITKLQQELIQKVKIAAVAKVRPLKPRATSQLKVAVPKHTGALKKIIIAIGASTGGVEALRELITALPERMPPIVITQHMPEFFTSSFAKRLDSLSNLQIVEARHGMVLEEGKVYIAPGGEHMEVLTRDQGRKWFCATNKEPLVSGHRPSVDVLFRSVADNLATKAVGVILTGMGRDGAEGLLAMRKNGSKTIGQSESSCVVYGMPKVAKQAGAVERELALSEIADELVTLSYQ